MRAMLTETTTDLATRYQAVLIEATLLAQKVYNIAVAGKIAYSILHYYGNTPLSPNDIVVLRKGSISSFDPEIPGRLKTWIFVCYFSGINPLVPSGTLTSGQVVQWGWTTPDWNGKEKTAPLAINPAIDQAWEDVWRVLMASAACTGLNQIEQFGGLKNSDGSWETDNQGNKVISEWGSVLKYVVNADDYSLALPYFDDNSQYSDLPGALSKSLVTKRQLAQAFLRFVFDASLAAALGLVRGTPAQGTPGQPSYVAAVPNSINTNSSAYSQDVANDLYNNPVWGKNVQCMRDAWLATTPVAMPTFVPTGTVITIPPTQLSPADTDTGPYAQGIPGVDAPMPSTPPNTGD
jgi:hypothetical protein